jgi:acyl-CoA thioesterase I
VDVLFVCLGANDGLRGISPELTGKNLRKILDRAKQEKTDVVLAGMQLPENYGPEFRKHFQSIYPKLAKEYDAPLIPFLLEGVAMKPELNQADGIHPNAAGAAQVAQHIWPVLDPVLKKREATRGIR